MPAATKRRGGDGSCRHCFAWANDRNTYCNGCRGWRNDHGEANECIRCHRAFQLVDDYCRFCTLVLRETEVDLGGTHLEGGDQLWFGRELALRATYSFQKSRKGRFHAKRQLAHAADMQARTLSPHLTDPNQIALFDQPDRDWTRLDENDPPALGQGPSKMLDDFKDYLKARGVDPRTRGAGSVRTLRIIVGRLGCDAPIREADVKAVSSLSSHHNGSQVIYFLRACNWLIPEDVPDAELARARNLASGLPDAYAAQVNSWIDVLLGTGSKPNRAVASATIYQYVWSTVPVLKSWIAAGKSDLREVSNEDVKKAIADRSDSLRQGAHVGLRSLFRALRRERVIFRDPGRTVTLTRPPKLPVPLPTDRLRGLLDKVDDPRSRLIVALVAVHALSRDDLASLLLEDLDRSRGQLKVRRPGRLDHVIYLDDLTMQLATDWVVDRFRRWPKTTSPYLVISRISAVDDRKPMVSTEVTRTPFRRIGISAAQLREDRIYDEARYTEDPVQLMRVFGVGQTTAMKYVMAAHPDRRPDPIQP